MKLKFMLCATAVALTTLNSAHAALIAHYDFDNSLTADQSGNGNNLNNVNVTSAAGHIGNAASFNGSDSYLWASNFLPSGSDAQTMTLSFWYRAATPSTALQPLIGQTLNGFGVDLDTDLVADTLFNQEATVSRPVNDVSGFQHVVMRLVFNSAFTFDTQLWVNGSLQHAPVLGGFTDTFSGNGQFEIGANHISPTGGINDFGTSAFFQGEIDEVFVFDTAISTDDIQNLYTFNGIPNPGAPLLMGLGLAMLWQRRRKA